MVHAEKGDIRITARRGVVEQAIWHYKNHCWYFVIRDHRGRRVKKEYVTSVYERRFSASRSAALAAAGIGAVAEGKLAIVAVVIIVVAALFLTAC